MLTVRVPDLENPYRDLVSYFMSQQFPANLQDKGTTLESVVAAIVATTRIRFGPMPNPESLVLIRGVVRNSIEKNEPIPILVPWGSKKSESDASIDVAELSGLRMLSCLQNRVRTYYSPGVRMNLRVEDIGGYYLFADQGQSARDAGARYVKDFTTLIRVLDLPFITVKLESDLMTEEEYFKVSDEIRPFLVRYLNDTDLHGFENYKELESWKELAKRGWQGIIPTEQRDYYRSRYAKLYPGTDLRNQTERFATYLAGALGRYKLKATGTDPEWGSNYFQLNFASPVPGVPSSIGERRIHYRTLPENMARTHIPPWRAHGYLKIEGNTVTPKLASWSEHLDLYPSTVEFERDGESVLVQADELLI